MSKRKEYFDWEELEMFEERFSRVESRFKVGHEGSGSELSSLDILYQIIKKADSSLESSEIARKSSGIP